MEFRPPSEHALPDGEVRELRDAAAYSFESTLGDEGPSDAWAPWFRLLVEHANDLIYLHSLDGKLLYVNRKLVDVTGWRREDIVGKNILQFIVPDYKRSAVARRDTPAAEMAAHRYEVEIVATDGRRIPLEVHSTPVTVDGKTVAWQGIARDIRERRRAESRMAAIYESARQIVSMLDLADVLAAIVSRSAEITGASSCSLWLTEDGRDGLCCEAAHEMPDEVRSTCVDVSSDHPAAVALRDGGVVILDASLPGAREYGLLLPGTETIVCLPLDGTGGAFGALCLSYTRRYVPDPDESAILSTFASHAAAAISNARLFESQRRKTQEATAIGQIGMSVGALDIDAVLHIAGAYVYDLFAADITAFLVFDHSDRLRPAFVARDGLAVDPPPTPPDAGGSAERSFSLDDHPVLAEAIRRERSLLVDDIRSDPLAQGDGRVLGTGAVTCLVVPLMSREKAMGVLLIAYTSHTHLTDVQVRLAETLAQQAAVALENAVMFQAVATAKREWETTFDAITDAVCIFSPQGTLVRANPAAGRMVGGDISGVQGRHYSEVLYGGQVPEHGDVFQQCLALRQPITREVSNLATAGVFQVAAYPILSEEGNCTGIVEYIKDITAQTDMQARLYHSARLAGVGELAAGVVHNFKNVLMGVSGMLDVSGVLLDRGAPLSDVRARLADAQEHVFRGNQVLQRLLDFARGMPQEVVDVHLDVLLPDVMALCKAHPASRGIYIRTELPPDLPSVRADPNQLHEVLVNLVLNALQAMSGRGTVSLGARADDGWLRLTVTDTGCGIPEEDLERIFEPFFSRRSSGPSGTGIGLPASLRMVRSMGGNITVESGVGKGATFTVALPTVQAQGPLGGDG